MGFVVGKLKKFMYPKSTWNAFQDRFNGIVAQVKGKKLLCIRPGVSKHCTVHMYDQN